MYCIYTDSDVAAEDGNLDHIIPLSLGGTNEFVVWADADYNSNVGSAVDGELSKDLLISPMLMRAGVKGHSKKTAVPRWKNAQVDGRPAQVALTPDGFKIWDARARRDLADHEIDGSQITLNFSIGAFTALRFLAKVALGGGYFVYGNAIRQAIDCASLRKIIMLDVEKAKKDEALRNCDFQICDRFHVDAQPGGPAYMYRVACELAGRSIFITEPFKNGVAFHVGITGTYIGTIFCPGATDDLPIDGKHDLGHVIALAPGSMDRCSVREAFAELLNAMEQAQCPCGSEKEYRECHKDADPGASEEF